MTSYHCGPPVRHSYNLHAGKCSDITNPSFGPLLLELCSLSILVSPLGGSSVAAMLTSKVTLKFLLAVCMFERNAIEMPLSNAYVLHGETHMRGGWMVGWKWNTLYHQHLQSNSPHKNCSTLFNIFLALQTNLSVLCHANHTRSFAANIFQSSCMLSCLFCTQPSCTASSRQPRFRCLGSSFLTFGGTCFWLLFFPFSVHLCV